MLTTQYYGKSLSSYANSYAAVKPKYGSNSQKMAKRANYLRGFDEVLVHESSENRCQKKKFDKVRATASLLRGVPMAVRALLAKFDRSLRPQE
jgi:hypothetical protein